MHDITYLTNIVRCNLHPADILCLDKVLVPLKEAIDVLADKFEFKVLFQFFEEMGLDTNALNAEKRRRNRERKTRRQLPEAKPASDPMPRSKQPSIDAKSQQAVSKETDSLVKLDVEALLSEDLNVERMKEADRALEAKSKLEASEMVEKGFRLGRLIKQESLVMAQERADAQEGIQKVLRQNCLNLKRIKQPLTALSRGATGSSEDSESQSNQPAGFRISQQRQQAIPSKAASTAAEITRELNSKFALQLQAQQ